MADLSKIRVGDKLRIEYTVTKCSGFGLEAAVDSPSQVLNVTISSASIIEAAEHIPAPKVFKRGDWVRHQSAQYRGISYKGVVVADGLGILTVSWNHDPMTLLAVAAADLEPDEAPE